MLTTLAAPLAAASREAGTSIFTPTRQLVSRCKEMDRELQVPLVQQDLPPAETYAQLCDSLATLYTVADAVLTRIHDRVTEETGTPSPSRDDVLIKLLCTACLRSSQ